MLENFKEGESLKYILKKSIKILKAKTNKIYIIWKMKKRKMEDLKKGERKYFDDNKINFSPLRLWQANMGGEALDNNVAMQGVEGDRCFKSMIQGVNFQTLLMIGN